MTCVIQYAPVLMIKRTQGDPASADLGSVLAARVAFEFPTLEETDAKVSRRNRDLVRKKAIKRESIELQNKIKALIFLLRTWKTRYEQKNTPSTLSTASEWNAGIHLRLSNKFDPQNLVSALHDMLSQTLSKERQSELACITSSSGDHTLCYGGVKLMSIVKPPTLNQRFIKMDDKSTGQTVFIKKVGTPRKRTVNGIEIGLDEYVFDHHSKMVKRYMVRAITPQERTLIYEYVQNGKPSGQGIGSPSIAPYQKQPFHSPGLKTFFDKTGSVKFYQVLQDPHIRAAFVTLFNTRDYICASGLMVNTANLSAEGKSFVQSTENFFPYRRWDKRGALRDVVVQGGGFVVIDLSKVHKDSIYGLGTIDSFAYASFTSSFTGSLTRYRVFDNAYLARLRTLSYGNRETQFSALPFDSLIAFSKNEGVDFSSIDEVKAPYFRHPYQGDVQLTSTLIMQLEGELPIVYPTVTVPSPLPRLSVVSAFSSILGPSRPPRALVVSSLSSTVPSPLPRTSVVSSSPSTVPSPSPRSSVASFLSADPSPLPRASVASFSSADPSPSPRVSVASFSSVDSSPSPRSLVASLSSADPSPSPSALVASLSSDDPSPSPRALVASSSLATIPSPSPRSLVASLSSADPSPPPSALVASLSSDDPSPSPRALVASSSLATVPSPSPRSSPASLSSADPSPSPRASLASLSSADSLSSTKTTVASSWASRVGVSSSRSSQAVLRSPVPTSAVRASTPAPVSTPITSSGGPAVFARRSPPRAPQRKVDYHKAVQIADQKRAQERAPRFSVFESTSPANKTTPNSSSNPLTITVTSS